MQQKITKKVVRNSTIFLYPACQAADITAFDADIIPKREEQLPLIKQCRKIVRKFNSIYEKTLKEPEVLVGMYLD